MDSMQETKEISAAAAESFAQILNTTRGAPRARVWIPSREGALPRVYIGAGDGYVEVYRVELLLADAARRSRGHFSRRALYPSQRAPYDAALKAYREHYAPTALATANEKRVALMERRRKAVLNAVIAGATTVSAIAGITGLAELDTFWIVQALHQEGEILARNLGTEREKIFA